MLMHNFYLLILLETTVQGSPEQRYRCSVKCTNQPQIQVKIKI